MYANHHRSGKKMTENKTLFDGDNFRVRMVSRDVRAERQEFEVVVRPLIALCVPLSSDGQIILVRQYRAAIDGASLEFPAGRVAADEDSQSAGRRELLEEIGFVADYLERIGSILTAPHFSNERVDVFAATGHIVQQPTPTAKEDALEVVVVPQSALYKLIREGRLSDAKSVAAISLAVACNLFTRVMQ